MTATGVDVFVDAVGISLAAVLCRGKAGAVVQDDVTAVVVLVKALGLVHYGETAVEIYVHSSLVRAAFEAVAVAVGGYGVLVEETVLVAYALVHDDGHIVAEAAVLLVEHVPTVITVQIGPAAEEVVARADGDFRRKAVGIALALVAVQVGIAVYDIVICGEVLHLQSRVAVLIEVASLYDVVVRLVVCVGHIAGAASRGLVALYEHAVVAGVGDVYMVEVPI